MSNVVLLDGVTLSTEPVAEVVSRIEDLLALAKDGHIRAVALAGVYNDGYIHKDFAATEGEWMSRLIGATSRLLYCLNRGAESD